jgi:hypothetical protein
MSDSLANFTPEQVGQLLEYLRFEQQKRREMRREISGALTDLVSAQLEPPVLYSGKDALELLEKLPGLLDRTVFDELERSRDISVALIQHIFAQAQAAGIALALNTPDLENAQLTDEANALCDRILAHGERPIGTLSAQTTAPALGPSADEIRAENARLRSQLGQPKRDWPEFQALVQTLKEKNAEVHELRARLKK